MTPLVAAGPLLAAPVDSARAVGAMYTVSLLAFAPLFAAGSTALCLRRASAQARTLAWRSAVVVLLALFAGRLLPLHWVAWVVPSSLATPFVALGRIQVTTSGTAAPSSGASVVELLAFVYVAGVAMVVLRMATGAVALRRLLNGTAPVRDVALLGSFADARATLGVGARTRLHWSPTVRVPVTWGLVRPVILLPSSAVNWSAGEQRLAILHELAHVRSRDWVFRQLARAACALYWMHPGVWWLTRRLLADSELACDERVLAAGARRSEYAALLLRVSAELHAVDDCAGRASVAFALTGGGIRARLARVLDARRAVRPLARGWTVAAVACTLALACPLSAVQLAPTRAVLTTLMRDGRWESRAYAVLGLARRADSLAVARQAAERDPSAQVRQWARYALDRRAGGPAIPWLRPD
jgi:beta-lactamase regulating signal transducer with metallopeptidase domain